METTVGKARSSIFPLIFFLVFLGITAIATVVAAADEAPKIDTGDTAWVLMASALVMLMTPGLAFFYGGLVRRKNVLSVLMQCFMIICLITMQWVLFGYSLSFGPDVGGLHRQPRLVRAEGRRPGAVRGLRGDDPAPGVHDLPDDVRGHHAGADHRRVRRAHEVLGLRVFTLLWATLVYDPVCHWVWGIGGFLRNWGALDFAGGTVVHINAGIAALARRSCSASAWASRTTSRRRTTCRSPSSARACSGSAGSASTPAARSAPTAWRPARSW